MPPELQGVSWDGPAGESVEKEEEEPLYAVPKKDHAPKFTVDDFVLHKLLGKGSFGKVGAPSGRGGAWAWGGLPW